MRNGIDTDAHYCIRQQMELEVVCVESRVTADFCIFKPPLILSQVSRVLIQDLGLWSVKESTPNSESVTMWWEPQLSSQI